MLLQLLNMSFIASFIIVIVLVARLLLKRLPKIFSYLLWSAVLFRLLCPFSLESSWSLLPVNSTPISSDIIYSQDPKINTGITSFDNIVNPVLPTPTTPYVSINPLQVYLLLGEFIWLIGFLTLLLYSIVSLLQLRRKLIGAVKLHNNVYLADHIAAPFVIGLIHPTIYLPSNISVQEMEYIILHEQIHIKRRDYIVKLVAFIAFAIHWFNPLVWLAFVLSNKDMEMSCDESVMKHMNQDIRSDYSASLLGLATGRKILIGTPLAFGEGDTKVRIKNIMRYKKPKLGLMVVIAVCVIAFSIGLIVDPIKQINAVDLTDIEEMNQPVDTTPAEANITYTQEEIDAAISTATVYFKEVATIRILERLWFDEEACTKMRTSYMNNGKGLVNGVQEENVIVLQCNFKIEDDPAFAGEYLNWNLIYIRENKESPWVLDDQGV